jgi:alpha 1,4-glycosyltransferase
MPDVVPRSPTNRQPTTDNNIIQSLWIGPKLSSMERLALRSFLANGHEVHLYTYGAVEGVPAGTILRDGEEILPSSRIFQYRDFASYSGFSNYFRYRLLLLRGGWWIDADMICLRPFTDLDSDHVFASENHEGTLYVSSGAIKAPAGSAPMEWAWSACDARDPSTIRWGETGPRLLGEAVKRFGLESRIQPAETFCPIGYAEWESLLDPDAPPLAGEPYAVHLWNEMWRRAGRDKDARYDPRCLYEQLRDRYGC